MDGYDAKAVYERLRDTDPQFEEKRDKLAEVVREEQPEAEDLYNSDHAAFLDGFKRVEKKFFNKFDDRLMERSRRGDIDAAAEALIQAGIADGLKGE
jgi:hypothetical protein